MHGNIVKRSMDGATHGSPSVYDGGSGSFTFAHFLETPLWVFDIDKSRVVMANAAAVHLWSATDEDDLCARDMASDMSPTVAARLKQYQTDFETGAVFNELWTLYPNGTPVTIKVFYHGYRLDDGRMAMLCEGKRQTDDTPENLRSAEALLHTDVMIALYCRSGPPLYMNPAARRMAINSDQQIQDVLVDPRDFDMLMFELDNAGEHSLVAKVHTSDGLRWYNLTAKFCRDALTGDAAILMTANDVTELKNARDKARYLADRDQLTGCFNRSFLQQRMGELAKYQPNRCALLYFDVDRFKQINDRFGHEMGDVVLKKLVSRAKSSIRRTDVLARLGGDEFVILFEDTPEEDAFASEIQRLFEVLAKPVTHQATSINVTVSMGVAFFAPGKTSFTAVLREADIALYASKTAGRNQLTFFNEQLGAAARERDQIELELKAAIENEEFVLFYQPRVDLKSWRVTSVEALVRWQHPVRGLVPPDKFIPICEETGMIEDLGCFILETGCQQAIEWRSAGLDLDVSINISPRQFADDRLMEILTKYSEMAECPTDRVELEITENVLIGDRELIAEKLRQITRLGYRIAIDDFGVGYSNLSYISSFPLECIKIDRSFINQLPESGPVIRLILTLAQQVGASTVAEGVETEAECAILAEEGCDQVQGYFFARPEPLDSLMATIKGIEARPSLTH